MKVMAIGRFSGMLLLFAFGACAPSAVREHGRDAAVARVDSKLGDQLFREVNDYRRSKGVGALQRHAGLDRLAAGHCVYLRDHRGSFSVSGRNVSHIGFEGRAAAAREYYQMPNVSENVAAIHHAGSRQVPGLLALMKSSKAHHQNMLDAWTHTGVAVVVDADGMAFATEIFATHYLSSQETQLRFHRF